MKKSSGLGFTQFRQSLRRSAIEPVYVFEGAESFFHDEGIRLLGGAAFPGGTSSVDRESVRGSEASLAEVLDLASTYPMSGGVRLIVVREADALRYESAEALRSYLARPNCKSCLVLSDVNFDKRRGLYKAMQDKAVLVNCSALDEPRTALWVKERLRESGFGISNDLADAISAGLSGEGLGRLEGELAKLMTHIGEPRPVEAGDLSILASVPRVETAFVVAKQVLQGKRGEAIASARALLRSGEEPVRLLGGMSWYFRNALKARAASSRRIPAREIPVTYGLNPDKVEQFRAEIGETSVEDLRKALAWCLRADRELKGAGARDPANAFERLIHGIGRRAGTAP
jgi:DNA polymerase-3 subunit delta